MCRVIGRSKLTKTHMFERLPKSLRVSENIESIVEQLVSFGYPSKNAPKNILPIPTDAEFDALPLPTIRKFLGSTKWSAIWQKNAVPGV